MNKSRVRAREKANKRTIKCSQTRAQEGEKQSRRERECCVCRETSIRMQTALAALCMQTNEKRRLYAHKFVECVYLIGCVRLLPSRHVSERTHNSSDHFSYYYLKEKLNMVQNVYQLKPL